jgi:hypothetical protein
MVGKYIYCDYCSGRFRTIFRANNQWQNVLLTTEDEFEYTAFGEDKNGELYVTDITEGEVYHLVDTSGQGPLKVAASEESPVSIFPNPNQGVFTAQWTAPANVNCLIEIVDVFGKQLAAEEKTSVEGINTITFSNSHLIRGTYFLVVHTNEGLSRVKFSVE